MAALTSPTALSPAFPRAKASTVRPTSCAWPMLSPADIMRMPAPITPFIIPPIRPAANACGLARGLRNQSFGSGELGQERLHLVGGSFLDQEVENYADGFFRSRAIDPDIGDETRDQFVHYPLASPTLSAGCCHNEDSNSG